MGFHGGWQVEDPPPCLSYSPWTVNALGLTHLEGWCLHGYLSHKKTPPPRTLQ